ncbi:hypothetical protein M405DRAFT_280511 [Rhizopogon salebrosus TDB-379]|nr:hypothetical protein M405DRAFT_280511 [Rhizopogon salebrosus TDB-379]
MSCLAPSCKAFSPQCQTSWQLQKQNTLQNEDDFYGLIEQCRVICDVVTTATKGQTDDDLNSELSDIIISLKHFVQNIHEAVASANERSVTQRALFAQSDRDKISSWVRELDRRVSLINMHLGMVTQRRIDQLSQQINRHTFNIDDRWRVILPNPPSPFFGRHHFVVRVAGLLLNRQHVTLCGPGGIGKTSLAKAVIHDPLVAERFPGRLFYISLDGFDASKISTRTVREQVCRAVGLDGRFSERWEEVTTLLSSEETVLVIDNVEALVAPRNAESVTRIIDDFASSPSIILLLTTRSRNAFTPYLVTQLVSVPTLERKHAMETFEHLCPQQIPTDIVEELLDGVDNHPLSVNIIARRAAQHGWTGEELLSAWRTQQAALLENGGRKSQSLRATVELSLNAPSVTGLGNDARKLLEIIAFFPQGLTTVRAKALCPSAAAIVDALCVHSMIHHEGNYFTMLKPMRLYLGHKTPNPDSIFLNTIRNMYYRELSGTIEQRQALILAEDVNIERLIIFDFRLAINLDDSCCACAFFLDNLAMYKPRATVLTTMLQELPVRSSGFLAKVVSRPAIKKTVSLHNKNMLMKSAGILTSSIRRSTLTSTFLRTLFVRVNLPNNTSHKNPHATMKPKHVRYLQGAVRPFSHRNRHRHISSSAAPAVTISRIHSCTSLSSFLLLLQEHRGVLACFTTEICRLSRKAQSLFEEFAHNKKSDSPVAFVHVDLNSSRDAAAVGIEFGVRVTPTFLFFVGGMKVYEIQGCDVQQLRMHVAMFLHPVHPHISIPVPALELHTLKPILCEKLPNLDAVSAKLKGFLEDSTTTWFQPFDTSLSKADSMEILFGTIFPYVKASAALQCLPIDPLFDLWHDVTSSISWNIPEDQLFPLVDLWRIAFLNPKISSWCADRNGLNSPLGLLLSKACQQSSKKYLVTLLSMLTNAFANRALGWKLLLSAQNNLAALLEHTLVHEDRGIRLSASSLAFNAFARLQELRLENLEKGDEEETDHLEMEISLTVLNAEWEASVLCAVFAAIERESDNDIAHRQVAALGLILRFSPFIDHLLRLLGALHAQRILKTKVEEKRGIWKMAVCALLEEVADKLCPPSVLI